MHKGHRYLFKHLDNLAAERGLAPLIVTFEEHPRAVLQSDYVPQLLTTTEERRALLSAFGEVLMLPFADIHALTAAEFMEVLQTQYGVSVLLMGYDHRFGSDRLHRPQDYRRIGEQCGIEVLTMSEFTEGEWHVSSTEIRSALENGNIAVANDLLGRPYSIRGTVVHGKGIGRTIGFPTANIEPEACKLVPKVGVYVAEGALVNIGTNPTVGNKRVTIEAYLPDYQGGDFYGKTLTLRFTKRLRDEKKFASLDELKEQIEKDLSNLRCA